MVRTVSGGNTRASGGKAPGKQAGHSTSSSSSDNSSSNSNAANAGGGNIMKIWPTPEWQKGVESFFPKLNSNSQNNNIDPSKDNATSTCTSEKSVSSASQVAASSSNSSIEQPEVSSHNLDIESLGDDNQ